MVWSRVRVVRVGQRGGATCEVRSDRPMGVVEATANHVGAFLQIDCCMAVVGTSCCVSSCSSLFVVIVEGVFAGPRTWSSSSMPFLWIWTVVILERASFSTNVHHYHMPTTPPPPPPPPPSHHQINVITRQQHHKQHLLHMRNSSINSITSKHHLSMKTH